jgi:AGZA family xanthine/uracil permease-like MFS transporter
LTFTKGVKMMSNARQTLDCHFGISARGSNLRTEIIGGLATFMAMAYILPVQAAIMHAGGAGMPFAAVFTATALICGVSSITMGLYANFPFALAPGMGTNAIIAMQVVAGKLTWQEGLGIVFVAGWIFVLTSFPIFAWLRFLGVENEKLLKFSLRETVVQAIPGSIKLGLAIIIGIFLLGLGADAGSGIGLSVVSDGGVSVGNLAAPAVLIGVVGILITMAMAFLPSRRNPDRPLVPGAFLLGIIFTTIIGIVFGVTKLPAEWISLPPSVAEIVGAIEVRGAFKLENFPLVLVTFMGDFFSTTGTALACGAKAGFYNPKTGTMPGMERIFYVDSTFSVIGAYFGLTTVTTYVESGAGVESGARTGLAAIVTGIAFLLSLLLSPIFLMFPGYATGAGLVGVGISMMKVFPALFQVDELSGEKLDALDLIIVYLMIGIFYATRDFASALCAALIFSTLLKVIRYSYHERPALVWTKVISSGALLVMAVLKFAVALL